MSVSFASALCSLSNATELTGILLLPEDKIVCYIAHQDGAAPKLYSTAVNTMQ